MFIAAFDVFWKWISQLQMLSEKRTEQGDFQNSENLETSSKSFKSANQITVFTLMDSDLCYKCQFQLFKLFFKFALNILEALLSILTNFWNGQLERAFITGLFYHLIRVSLCIIKITVLKWPKCASCKF